MAVTEIAGLAGQKPRAGSWGTLNLAFVKVPIVAALGDNDVIKAWAIPQGTRIASVFIVVDDVADQAIDVGYGSATEIAGHDAASTDANRILAWAAAKRTAFADSLALSALSGTDSRASTRHEPIDVEDADSFIALTADGNVTAAGRVELHINYEFIGTM